MISIHLFRKSQVSADSAGNGTNLNYKCLVICSWFLGKIIFRYTTTYFNRDTPRVSEYTTPSYGRSCPPSWLCPETGWGNSRKIRKTLNNARPSPGVITYVLVSTKNNKVGIRMFCWKLVHKKELSPPNILGFRSTWRVLWPNTWHSLF